MLDQIERQEAASTLVLAAVLLAPNCRPGRIDVMTTYMRVVNAMALPVKPENWGPSIKGMRARELVNDDMETIRATASLGSFYQVPNEYAQAAQAAWKEA